MIKMTVTVEADTARAIDLADGACNKRRLFPNVARGGVAGFA